MRSAHAHIIALSLIALLSRTAPAQPLTTAFTYQGQVINAGAPATGLHDFRFRLYDASSGGAQVGSTLCADNITVSQGGFTVTLDFAAQFAGQQRFIEIDVRPDTGLACADTSGFTTLAPRQPLTAAPNALFALTSTSATQLNGQPSAFFQNANNLATGTLPGARLTGNYNNALNFSNVSNTFTGSFSGSGAGLTTLNAANLSTGILPAARLPVPLSLTGTGASILNIANSSTAFHSAAIKGDATSATGSTYGGWFTNTSTNGLGARGEALSPTGSNVGLYGNAISPDGIGVLGANDSTTGLARGIAGTSESTTGTGVYALADSLTGANFGVYSIARGSLGNAVFGWSTALTGATIGGSFLNESTSGTGVRGEATNSTGATFGVVGLSDGNAGKGVYGFASSTTGFTYGVHGVSASSSGVGIYGQATNASGGTAGRFETSATNGLALYALASNTTGSNYAGRFQNDSTTGTALFGDAAAISGSAIGVRGETSGTTGVGVRGQSFSTTGTNYGVWGLASSTSGRGVVGTASATTGTIYGVYGSASTAAGGFAVYASGDMGASGVKPFRIDHPADPTNKYLLHYAAESPDVINFYTGKATLDSSGEAIIQLPHYFSRINKDPRYTLTPIGAPMPMLHIAQEIDEAALATGAAALPTDPSPPCSFRIAGGAPGAKVSWEVKALRNDTYVQHRGAPVEVEKQGPERGTYQHPEFYNQPPEKGMSHLDPRTPTTAPPPPTPN